MSDTFKGDLEDYLPDDPTSEIVSALANIEAAVEKVEQAVKNKSSNNWIFTLVACVFGFWLVSLPSKLWYSNWRYAVAYDVTSDKVQINSHPHDCAFLTAPLGEKYCHYERVVSTVRWATSMTGHPIASYDEGKTWYEFTPDANTVVPQYNTLEEIYINWEKIDDD